MRDDLRIREVRCTPVAVALQRPVRHSDGTETHAVRTVVEVDCGDGLIGLGEFGNRVSADVVAAAQRHLVGASPYDLEPLRLALARWKFPSQQSDILFAGIELACLDLQARLAGRPLHDLLGGAVRRTVPQIAYVFRLADGPGGPAVKTDAELVAHAKELLDDGGFTTIKLKAGSASWRDDVSAVHALREAFPDVELRVDPNAIWSLETSIRAAAELRPDRLEWLEDPVLGLPAMAEVTHRGGVPTATNMCLTNFGELAGAVRTRAVDVVLLDLWYQAGVTMAKSFARAAEAFGLGIGIHSGSGSCELGIGQAAMLHLSAALPYLVHAADGMYHHVSDDVIVGGKMEYVDGALAVPTGPGLGVDLDRDKLEQYAGEYSRLRDSFSGGRDGADGLAVYPSW